MAASDPSMVLSKKAKVVASTDAIVGVPAGTEGKVVLVNGLTWIRYWVRFANGITTGSINRNDLATPEEWDRIQSGGGATASADGAGAGGADDAAAGDDDGGGVTVNGVVVPSKLIERAKAARARLAA